MSAYVFSRTAAKGRKLPVSGSSSHLRMCLAAWYCRLRASSSQACRQQPKAAKLTSLVMRGHEL